MHNYIIYTYNYAQAPAYGTHLTNLVRYQLPFFFSTVIPITGLHRNRQTTTYNSTSPDNITTTQHHHSLFPHTIHSSWPTKNLGLR